VLLSDGQEGRAMPRKGHREEEIVYALRQIEGGKKVTEVCREGGVTIRINAASRCPALRRSRGGIATYPNAQLQED
jgi:hypothetical protein